MTAYDDGDAMPGAYVSDFMDKAMKAGMSKKDIVAMMGGLFKPAMIPAPPPFHGASGGAGQALASAAKPPAWLQRDEWGGIGSSSALLRMLAMRFRLEDGQQFPFEFIMPTKTKDKVVVFLIINGEPTHVEDDWGMYPSDALVTKLRLIAQ